MAPAFAHCFGHLFLRAAEPVHQLAITRSLVDGVQVCALDVFNDRDFQHLGVSKFTNQNRDLM